MSQYREINTDGNAELEHYRQVAAACLWVDSSSVENRHTGGILPRFIKGILSRVVRFFHWLNDDYSVDVFPPGHPT